MALFLETLGYAAAFLVGPIVTNLIVGSLLAYYTLVVVHKLPRNRRGRVTLPPLVVGVMAYVSVVVSLLLDIRRWWPVLVLLYSAGVVMTLRALGDGWGATQPKIQGLLLAACVIEPLARGLWWR